MKNALLFLSCCSVFLRAIGQDTAVTVGPDGALRGTNFFRQNQSLLGQSAILSTNGFSSGVLTADDLIANRVTTDAAVLSYDGVTQPQNYAAPISYVKLLAPGVADTIEDLLATPTAGLSRWAYVLLGAGAGQWIYCPEETDADNGKNVRRPEEVVSDSSPGRWAKMSAGSGLGPAGPVGAPGPAGPPGPQGDSDALSIAAALGSTVKAFTVEASFLAASGTVPLKDGQGQFVAVWLPKRSTITGVGFVQVTSGGFTGDAYNGVALYRYADGLQTLLAQSANDERVWKSDNSTYVKVPFTTPQVLAPGLYFVWALYNSSDQSTAPALGAANPLAVPSIVTLDFTNGAKVSGVLSGLTAFPATVNMSTATASQALPVFTLY